MNSIVYCMYMPLMWSSDYPCHNSWSRTSPLKPGPAPECPPAVIDHELHFTFCWRKKEEGRKKRCLRFRPSFSLLYSEDESLHGGHRRPHYICSGGYNLTFYINEQLISFTRQAHLYCHTLTVIVSWQFSCVIPVSWQFVPMSGCDRSNSH